MVSPDRKHPVAYSPSTEEDRFRVRQPRFEQSQPLHIETRAAGNSSEWLRGAEASLRLGKGGADVPCGTCTACCRSSMFIHIGPEETQTIQRIRRALMFPAPGLPKGHVLMGYSDEGHCPMLVDGKCSICEYRPQTCRSYDYRVFAAAGIAVDQQSQAEIAHRVSDREGGGSFPADGLRRSREFSHLCFPRMTQAA